MIRSQYQGIQNNSVEQKNTGDLRLRHQNAATGGITKRYCMPCLQSMREDANAHYTNDGSASLGQRVFVKGDAFTSIVVVRAMINHAMVWVR